MSIKASGHRISFETDAGKFRLTFNSDSTFSLSEETGNRRRPTKPLDPASKEGQSAQKFISEHFDEIVEKATGPMAERLQDTGWFDLGTDAVKYEDYQDIKDDIGKIDSVQDLIALKALRAAVEDLGTETVKRRARGGSGERVKNNNISADDKEKILADIDAQLKSPEAQKLAEDAGISLSEQKQKAPQSTQEPKVENGGSGGGGGPAQTAPDVSKTSSWLDDNFTKNEELEDLQQVLGRDPEFQKRMGEGISRYDDGKMGPRTRGVIQDYAKKHGLDLNKMSMKEVLEHAKEHMKEPEVKKDTPEKGIPKEPEGEKTEKQPETKAAAADKKPISAEVNNEFAPVIDIKGLTFEDEVAYREQRTPLNTTEIVPVQVAKRSDGIKPVDLTNADKALAADKNNAGQSVFSLGDKGQIFVTRVAQDGGAQRYEVSEALAKNGSFGKINLMNDDQFTAATAQNLFGALKNTDGFNPKAGVIMNANGGVNLRIYEASEGHYAAEVVNPKASDNRIKVAQAQTPNGLGWDDMKTPEAVAKALDEPKTFMDREGPIPADVTVVQTASADQVEAKYLSNQQNGLG